jgi:CRP-like cAMP-binding protein
MPAAFDVNSARTTDGTNRLLARIPARDRDAISAKCREVGLAFGRVLAEPGAPIRFVHFPVTCSISLIASAGQGAALEVGLIGSEGMLGASLAMSSNSAPLRAVVYAPGAALQMTAAAFRGELRARASFRSVVQSYCMVRLMQISQTAACTNYHSLDERLCRWLLMTHDRALGASVHLTHEFLSKVLGVRRVGVTHAAGVLQAAKLIEYHRGEIIILDRARLLQRACQCYAADRQIYETAMS